MRNNYTTRAGNEKEHPIRTLVLARNDQDGRIHAINLDPRQYGEVVVETSKANAHSLLSGDDGKAFDLVSYYGAIMAPKKALSLIS